MALGALTNLTSLDLSGCVGVTNVGLILLSSNLRRLANLELSWCLKITCAGRHCMGPDQSWITRMHLCRVGPARCIMECGSVRPVMSTWQSDNCMHGHASTLAAVVSKGKPCRMTHPRHPVVPHHTTLLTGLKGLAASAERSLTGLNISGCQLVGEVGFGALGGLTKLQRLAATNLGIALPAVTDASLVGHAIPSLQLVQVDDKDVCSG
jgi:hypothetical protein